MGLSMGVNLWYNEATLTNNTKLKNDSHLSGSVCVRCGKQRVIVDSYEEKTETSVVTYTTAICSDPDCQKIVDKQLKEDEVRRAMVKSDQLKREILRKEAVALKKRANSI